MVRFIGSLDFRAHVDSRDLKRLKWLSVADRAKYFRLLQVFRIYRGTAPSYLMQGFQRVNAVHTYTTRGSTSNFHFPSVTGNDIVHKGFFLNGAKDWNALPSILKVCSREAVFKAKLKEHLFSSY